MKNKKHIFELIQHFIVGFFLTLKGFDKLSHYPIIGSIVLSFGLILLFYFVSELIKAHQSKTLNLLANLFEAVALLLATYLFYTEGKLYIQYATLIASIGFFITFFILVFKNDKKHAEKGLR